MVMRCYKLKQIVIYPVNSVALNLLIFKVLDKMVQAALHSELKNRLIYLALHHDACDKIPSLIISQLESGRYEEMCTYFHFCMTCFGCNVSFLFLVIVDVYVQRELSFIPVW